MATRPTYTASRSKKGYGNAAGLCGFKKEYGNAAGLYGFKKEYSD
jgi:hypothetical protein